MQVKLKAQVYLCLLKNKIVEFWSSLTANLYITHMHTHTHTEVKKFAICENYVSKENFKKRRNTLVLKILRRLQPICLLLESFILSVSLLTCCLCVHTCACMVPRPLQLIHFTTFAKKPWWPPCQHVWKIDGDLVTFDDSKNKFSFFRWFQILRSRADLAYLDWARRGEPSQRQQLLFHDPVGQQPRPPPSEWESCPWERHGRSKGEV